MNKKFTVSLLVNNHFGVLNRITGLYSKRGYNIDSLTVGVTENPEYSRMTIVSQGDEDMREQVVRQLHKLHDVKMVTLLPEQCSVSIEQMLIKLNIDEQNRPIINELINDYKGKIMDSGNDFIMVLVAASADDIDQFIEKAEGFGILEICRSGVISMGNGKQNMISINQ